MVEQADVPEGRRAFFRGDAHQVVQAFLGTAADASPAPP